MNKHGIILMSDIEWWLSVFN